MHGLHRKREDHSAPGDAPQLCEIVNIAATNTVPINLNLLSNDIWCVVARKECVDAQKEERSMEMLAKSSQRVASTQR